MMFSRGDHHTAETAALPGPDETSTAAADTSDDKTPPIWWVKTIASYLLLALAVGLLAALVVVPRLTGSIAYTVLTGSMQPTYPPGTLIVVKPTPGDQLKAGDVVTFQPKSGDPSVTTHRIVSIVYDAKGERKFITKGDANNTQDEPIVEAQIRGRLLYSVPQLGRINSIMSGASRSILVFLVAAALGAYALWMWISSIRDRRKSGDDPDGDRSPDDRPVEPLPPVTVDDPPTADWHTPAAAPTCHACGAPQVQAEPTTPRHAAPPPNNPDNAVTRPIPVVR